MYTVQPVHDGGIYHTEVYICSGPERAKDRILCIYFCVCASSLPHIYMYIIYYLYTIIYRVCVIVTFDRFGTRSEDHGRSGAIAFFLTFFFYVDNIVQVLFYQIRA